MELREVLESERAGIRLLRAIRLQHSDHPETLRLVAEAMEEATERLIKLNDLYHYKDGTNSNGNESGNEHENGDTSK